MICHPKRKIATDHSALSDLVNVRHNPSLADEPKLGLVGQLRPPDLQTHWTEIAAVDDERKQNAGLVERHRSEKHGVGARVKRSVVKP